MNKIKHPLLSALFLFSIGTVFSQNIETQNQQTIQKDYHKLIEVYGEAWVNNNPEAVTVLEECFSTRISYLHEPLTVNDKYPLLSSFPLMNKMNPSIQPIDYAGFNPETFNPITYNLPFLNDLKQVVRVDGTNYLIVIEPVTRN